MTDQPIPAQDVRTLLERWQGEPWPLRDVLARLADAVDHLLDVHNCDAHGWEGVVAARDQARRMICDLESLLTAAARQPEPKPAFACDYQRMWDLVRSQRSELLDADLITREEYAELVAAETRDKSGQGSPSARRLESYDDLRAKLAASTPRRPQDDERRDGR